MILKKENGAYTLYYKTHELHFFTLWELIAYLSNINTIAQQN